MIDNLTFTLAGNQLSRVDDAAAASAYNGGFEFKDGVKQANEYTYDSNGNLTKDLNKGISNISYNCLNLPSAVTFSDGSTIAYTYGADGTKLKTVHKIGSTTTTTDYCGNVVYENGVETSREMIHQNVMVASQAAVIERGTIIPPTYIKPISGGRYTSGFGRRWGRMHKGVDWACPIGTTVYASCAGTVISASYNGGYGNNVVISHADGRLTRYAHNSKLLVKAGQHVEQGEPIALSGSTGRSTGPHVHFEIYINGSAVDPLKYISN